MAATCGGRVTPVATRMTVSWYNARVATGLSRPVSLRRQALGTRAVSLFGPLTSWLARVHLFAHECDVIHAHLEDLRELAQLWRGGREFPPLPVVDRCRGHPQPVG